MKKPLKITLVIFLIVLGIAIILYYIFFLSPPLVHLEVTTDKKQYKVGEEITIISRLYKNSLRKMYLDAICDVYEQGFYPEIHIYKKNELKDLYPEFLDKYIEKYPEQRMELLLRRSGACYGNPGYVSKFYTTTIIKTMIPDNIVLGEYIIESNFESALATGSFSFKTKGATSIIIE